MVDAASSRLKPEFARKLREWRKGRGWRQCDLSWKVDLSPAYIGQIERCQVPPPANEFIVGMAEALNVSPDIALAAAGRVADDVAEIIGRHPLEMTRLVRAMGNLDLLDSQGRDQITHLADSLEATVRASG